MRGRLLPLVLGGLLVAGTCEPTDVLSREFCLKVYVQGTTPPATCNSRVPSESFDPSVSATIRRGASVTFVLEAVLLSGANGSLMLEAPGQSPGATMSASAKEFKVPGSVTLTATGTALSGNLMKYSVEDDGRGTKLEVVIEVIVTS